MAVGAAACARRLNRPRSAAPIACRSFSRDAWIASGSTMSIRSAISISLGSRMASALNAGSSELDLSVAATARITGSASTSSPRAPAISAASSIPASPRSARTDHYRPAPASPAHPARRSASTMTGAEKLRLIDSNGVSVTLSNVTLCRGWSRTISRSGQISCAAFLADQRGLERDGHRLLVGLAGRRILVLLEVQRCASCASASCSSRARTFGVPAWLYQILNGVRSTPLPSSSARRNRRRSPLRRRARSK